jgi:4-hydroxybenzoyl-CoA thioesterase
LEEKRPRRGVSLHNPQIQCLLNNEICGSRKETAWSTRFVYRRRRRRSHHDCNHGRGEATEMQSTQIRSEHADQAGQRFQVKPADVGVLGVVDGATVIEWIDRAAYAAATRWCGGQCVAASMGNFHLDRAIGVGEVVEVHADLVYTGRRSMHILVTLCSSDPTLSKARQTAQCSIIFVAIDDAGCPVEVPQWSPVTMLDLQRQRQARVRIRVRRRIEDAMPIEVDSASCTSPRFLADGKVSAGRVVRWIDEAACACGTDWTGDEVITSYVAGIRFCRLIAVGDTVKVSARVIHTGLRSVHTAVQVTTEERPDLVAHGVVVVVSLDARGGAAPVPTWEPASDDDRRAEQHARHLIELRQFIEPFTSVPQR